MKKLTLLRAGLALLLGVSLLAKADLIRDLTTVQGVRDNQLLGYGLVVAWMAPVTRRLRRHLLRRP